MFDLCNALICIDIQNDFCPGGALAVTDGDGVVPVANRMMHQARKANAPVVLTQDWHPAAHKSFASNHDDKKPFDIVEMSYGQQVLWPNHCVQGTFGAQFHDSLHSDLADLVIRKGFRPEIDSYSAFFENDQRTPTGLHGYLQTRGVTTVTLVGLATDFCVAFSALDAARLGYEVRLVRQGCRAIDLDGSLAEQMAAMQAAGISVIEDAL
ncbi:MAG: bifunctional nicotinamidase/pyrazinamidase [Candidatus Puniceispirillaceae bacterium]